jgi:putative acetyltransferase
VSVATPGVTVRRIRVADAAAFRDCLDAVARERRYLAQVEAPPLARVEAFVAESVAADAAQFVALDGAQLVGWCDVFPHWAHALQHAGTLGMGVREGWRGQGLGAQLLRATLDHALAKGICRVALEARADNTRAIRLYERFGFVHEGIARAAMRFDGVWHDAVRMALLQGAAVSAAAAGTGPATAGPAPR